MNKIMSSILLGAATVAAIWAHPLQARHHAEPMKPIKTILLKDVELTVEQKELIRAFRSEHRSQLPPKEFHRDFEKIRLMELVLFDEISIEDAHEELDLQLNRNFERHLIQAELGLKLLDSYSSEQRAQVLENLEFVQARAGEKKSALKRRAEADFDELKVTDGVELSRSEKKVAAELKEIHIQHRFDLIEQLEELSFDDYFLGTTEEAQIIEDLEDIMEERRELAHQKIDLWSSLVSELSEQEKQIVQDNLKKKTHQKESHSAHPREKKRR